MRLLISRAATTMRGLFSVATCSAALASPYANAMEVSIIERLDGTPFKVLVDRPGTRSNLPIMLFIDGSGCLSVERDPFQAYTALPAGYANNVARVFVDKTGVTPDDNGRDCSPEFVERESLDQRVFDHLRAIQHLRKHADWWNGEMLIFGWSDGGTIGASVAAFTPEVTRAVIGGMGGGIPMTQQFEDYSICAPDRSDDREACIEELRQKYAEIRANPSSELTWFGDDNSYKAWATRLDIVEFNLIRDLEMPLLIVHGELDRDSVPVEAARELVRLLREAGGVDFEYWEVPDMQHGTRSLGDERGEAVRIAMLNWLLGQPPGEGGPPGFGRSPAE